MLRLECDTVLEHFSREMKGTFPLKKSALPFSISCGKIQLEQVAFSASYILIFASFKAEQMSQLKSVVLIIHNMFWRDCSLVHLEVRG